MASKKNKKVKAVHHSKRTSKPKHEPINSSPEFMVQISDPKLLRKDILESLKESIIFMQGYEKFRAVQEEKVTIFKELKSHISALNVLNNKLKKYLPKGNLPLNQHPKLEILPVEDETLDEEEVIPALKSRRNSDLDELENNLRDIEKQLQKIE